ncbi:MAG: PTS sugar transporter subunit IIA [Clostridium sp.]|uniref:PTS sugar transporter subunit IIA n=1 Tax=Clostridium sp. TaxID=1506 RepID=UPI002A8B77DC|nr:PTS sugar transporter subunit IIA [Clostridium sp.]MDY5098686.1 PTS sugar transporter subunit IIA [Clostridium sp.]
MINREMIVLDSELKDRNDVIKYLSEKARTLGYISDMDKYVEAVKKREAEFSTAIGYEVSIPHGKSESVNEAFIAFLRSKNGLYWDDNKESEVKLVFLLGVPESKKETLHLKILAQISRRLMDEEFREKLIKSDYKQVYELLHEIEKNISVED